MNWPPIRAGRKKAGGDGRPKLPLVGVGSGRCSCNVFWFCIAFGAQRTVGQYLYLVLPANRRVLAPVIDSLSTRKSKGCGQVGHVAKMLDCVFGSHDAPYDG